MWPGNFWGERFWPLRYWTKTGANAPVVLDVGDLTITLHTDPEKNIYIVREREAGEAFVGQVFDKQVRIR